MDVCMPSQTSRACIVSSLDWDNGRVRSPHALLPRCIISCVAWYTTSLLLTQAVRPPAVCERHRQQPQRLSAISAPSRRASGKRSAVGPRVSLCQPVDRQ